MSFGEAEQHHSPTADASGTLVIGYGNPLRGDDGAGPAVVQRLEEMLPTQWASNVSCVVSMQLTPEMSETMSHVRRVVFIDATVNLLPGEVMVNRVWARQERQSLGHHMGPEQLLAMSQETFGACPEAWVVSIGVEKMDMGEVLSPDVTSAVERLAGHLRYWIGRWTEQDVAGEVSVDVAGAV